MMSTDQTNFEIQNRILPHGNIQDNLLFNDSAIILLGRFQWEDDVVTNVTFTLYNIDYRITYKICGITKCEADEEYDQTYILIHMAEDGTSSKSEITVSSKELGSLSLPENAEVHFLFKVKDTCPQELSCGFDHTKPRSKDGCIIICI